MQDTEEIDLMMKFLTRNYPVHRIKYNSRFKRSIILDNDQVYPLSDKNSIKELQPKLMHILKTIFSTSDDINKNVLKNFLNLK